jgi:GTPase
MPIPKVAIIGRPNVGKSSLFNWLAGRLISVVDPAAGVTRDRVEYLLHEGDRYFELIDTGGMGIEDGDNLTEQIEEQIQVAIDQADLLLFVVDGQSGLVPLDREVADRLRRIDKPKLLLVNKCDSVRTEAEVHEFRRLCDGPLVVTSVKANRNRDELIAAILEHLPAASEKESSEGAVLATEPELKLAIVGRRNVGKSTFINALAESDRVIVSEVPGTTRDSVDIRFEVDGKRLLAIDTPGVRKRKSLASDVEFYGLVRARRSIRRADVALMFFDARDTISRVDVQLVDEIAKNCKPCIFVVNKWDLAKDMSAEAWSEYLLQSFGTMRYVPVAFLTAKDGRNVRKLVNLAQNLFKQTRIRVPTGKLNRLVRAAILSNQPAMRKGKRAKIYYATQVATEPPTIVLKCNDPSLFDEAWKRYLLGTLRDALAFEEVPIRLYFRTRDRADESAPSLEELPEPDDERTETKDQGGRMKDESSQNNCGVRQSEAKG